MFQSLVNRILAPLDLALIRAKYLHLTQGPITITLECHSFAVDEQHIPFWRAFENGSWEPDTRALLRSELKPSDVFWDCGAWLGPFTLYASQICRQVYSFEPDPIACSVLLGNVTRNRLPVRVFNLALSDRNGIGAMSSFAGELGDSQSSLLRGTGVPVTTITPSSAMDVLSLEPPTFLKMDIEGAEFAVIPAMRNLLQQYRPTLHLSTHAQFLPESERQEKIRGLLSALEGVYDVRDLKAEDGAVLLKPAMALAR